MTRLRPAPSLGDPGFVFPRGGGGWRPQTCSRGARSGPLSPNSWNLGAVPVPWGRLPAPRRVWGCVCGEPVCGASVVRPGTAGAVHGADSDAEEEQDGAPRVLQFDYEAVASRLFQEASGLDTPSQNRKRLYKVIQRLQQLAEGLFPEDDIPEAVYRKLQRGGRRRRARRPNSRSPSPTGGNWASSLAAPHTPAPGTPPLCQPPGSLGPLAKLQRQHGARQRTGPQGVVQDTPRGTTSHWALRWRLGTVCDGTATPSPVGSRLVLQARAQGEDQATGRPPRRERTHPPRARLPPPFRAVHGTCASGQPSAHAPGPETHCPQASFGTATPFRRHLRLQVTAGRESPGRAAFLSGGRDPGPQGVGRRGPGAQSRQKCPCPSPAGRPRNPQTARSEQALPPHSEMKRGRPFAERAAAQQATPDSGRSGPPGWGPPAPRRGPLSAEEMKARSASEAERPGPAQSPASAEAQRAAPGPPGPPGSAFTGRRGGGVRQAGLGALSRGLCSSPGFPGLEALWAENRS
ncbi:PREDICTED: collagen alpha-1(I) chain-like [Condylura cristata]|uniref:collagen alpha-1(I) chain-like n=1 Tax=Condylura cristata TaxID=143302 RepID=UPI000643A5B4|nr:PREDICTED: collagen alpha-1(I) chain-like [Condylura cristata]